MSLPRIAGRIAFIFEAPNFDVDLIVGPENINEQDIERLGKLALRDYDPEFSTLVRPGDVLVANANFGYGHPHYPPMIAMRSLGISAVIAESFAPGYWREEMEEGFPQITCPGIMAAAKRWDPLLIDFQNNTIQCGGDGQVLSFVPFSPSELSMLSEGGLVGYLKKELQMGRKAGNF